jgi:hypothetical protein
MSKDAIGLNTCVTYAPSAGLYIDPIKLLQYLEERAILLAERTATPRTDALTTELLRGHRQEILALQTELRKVIKNAPTT